MRYLIALFSMIFYGSAAAGIAMGICAMITSRSEPLYYRLAFPLVGIVLVMMMGWAIAVPLALLIGWPTHMVLTSCGLTSERYYALAGAGIGAALTLLPAAHLLHTHGDNGGFALMLVISLTPACIAGAVAFRRTLDGKPAIPRFI